MANITNIQESKYEAILRQAVAVIDRTRTMTSFYGIRRKKFYAVLRSLLLFSFVFTFFPLYAQDIEELEERYYARAKELAWRSNQDSAFLYLDSLSLQCGQYDPTLYSSLMVNPTFRSLHSDARWGTVMAQFRKARREVIDQSEMDCPQKSTELSISAGVTHYHLNASLGVKAKTLQVKGTLSVDFHQQPFIDLALWKFSEIHEVSENGRSMRYVFNSGPAFQWLQQAQCLRIYRGSEDHTDIRISYTAQLDSLDTWMASCEEDFVQLSMYMAWFPCNPYGSLFTGEVMFGLDAGYQLTASGNVSREGDQWLIRQPWPSFDFEIIASPRLKRLTKNTGRKQIEIDYLTMGHQDLDSLATACNEIVALYSKIFRTEPDMDELKIVLSPLNIGGISRRNFVVTGANQYSEFLFALLAHEIGHLWWHNAPSNSWLDWMNESFAEYSKLQALRKHYGEQVFQDYLAAYREQSYRTCPIRGLDREVANANVIFYQKGAIILCDLQAAVGDARFYKWLNTLIKKRVADHEQLMRVTSSVLKRPWADWLESRLSE